MHTCSKCGARFEEKAQALVPSWWLSLAQRNHSGRQDLENWGKVRCPACGQVEAAGGLRAFGLLSGAQLKLLMTLFALAAAAFVLIDLVLQLRG